MPEETRAEYLQWAKDRALQYVDAGDLSQALMSFLSDLNKHDELRNHPGRGQTVLLQMGGGLSTPAEVRKWINGFH